MYKERKYANYWDPRQYTIQQLELLRKEKKGNELAAITRAINCREGTNSDWKDTPARRRGRTVNFVLATMHSLKYCSHQMMEAIEVEAKKPERYVDVALINQRVSILQAAIKDVDEILREEFPNQQSLKRKLAKEKKNV